MQNQNKAIAAKKPSALMLTLIGGALATSAWMTSSWAQSSGQGNAKPQATASSSMANTPQAGQGTGPVSVSVDAKGVIPALVSAQPASQANVSSKPPEAAAEPLPVLQMGNTNTSASSGQIMNGDLAEYTKLQAEKRKLELMRDIAKLRAEKEEFESGKSATSAKGALPKDLQAQMVQMQAMSQANAGPSQEQLLYESVAVLGIFGGGGKYEAKLFTNRGNITVEAGHKLPTGETVQDVKQGAVYLTKGKASRKLTPTSERPVSMAPASNGAPQGQGGQGVNQVPSSSPFSGAPPQMIPPFNPAELLGTPQVVGAGQAGTGTAVKSGL